MTVPDILLHDDDEQLILGNFDFMDSLFDINETIIPELNNDFLTPIEQINNKLNGKNNFIKIAHLNTRSLPRHIDEFKNVVQSTSFDIIGVCESFICKNTPTDLYVIPGYKFFHKDRDMTCRGGVGLYIKEELPSKYIQIPLEQNQPEVCFVEVTIGKTKIAIGEIYRSPKIPYGILATLRDTISVITAKYEHTIILGDFNIDHLKFNSSALKFLKENIT